jgi:hypothetical protein
MGELFDVRVPEEVTRRLTLLERQPESVQIRRQEAVKMTTVDIYVRFLLYGTYGRALKVAAQRILLGPGIFPPAKAVQLVVLAAAMEWYCPPNRTLALIALMSEADAVALCARVARAVTRWLGQAATHAAGVGCHCDICLFQDVQR